MKLLEGRKAVITGAASPRGIGFATARLFARQGARVALLDLAATDPKTVAAGLGPDHLGLSCDVRDKDSCDAVVAQVAAAFGGIDLLVGNAGVVYGTALTEITPPEYDEVLDVNLRGNFHMSQAIAPLMRRNRGGAIVLINPNNPSGAGIFGRSHYAAAKAGLFGLAKALARELAPDGIRVNAVAPGVIDNVGAKGARVEIAAIKTGMLGLD